MVYEIDIYGVIRDSDLCDGSKSAQVGSSVLLAQENQYQRGYMVFSFFRSYLKPFNDIYIYLKQLKMVVTNFKLNLLLNEKSSNNLIAMI